MPSAFANAGAATESSEYAPLHTGRFTTGLWTNRSPLRDAAMTSLQEKAGYGRQDSLIGGINSEITSRLTLARRPGQSVYNSQIFPAINRFYGFRSFSTSAEHIRVMADTAGAVYDATGPSTQLNIWNKSAGAGSTYFLSVGNTLYMANGVDLVKWVQTTKSWAAGATFNYGDFILDPNNNIQAVAPATSISALYIQVSGGVLSAQLPSLNPFVTGQKVTIGGCTGAAAVLNGLTVTLTLAAPAAIYANVSVANVAQSTGTISTAAPTATGSTAPTWSATTGGYTQDNGVIWVNRGSAVQAWGVTAPTTAPTIATANLPITYATWTASTIYTSSLLVVDGSNYIQKLTTPGTTGSSAPWWNETKGGTTTDGSAVWTNQGSATWVASAAFPAGSLVSVTFSYFVQVPVYNGSHGAPSYSNQPVTVTDFFSAVNGGLSGSSAPAWVDGNGSLVTDGTVVWKNLGTSATWASLIGGSVAISSAQTVLDSNGNLQNIVTSGKSGSTQPTWSNIAGGSTTDGTAVWTNTGPFAAAAQSPQIYAYAYGRSVAGEISNLSPLSAAITLPAESYVNVQGATSPNPADDTVYIFRTAKGGSTQLLIASIPMPAGATWTYADYSTDAQLNVTWQGAQAYQLTPPPAGAIAPVLHLSRIFVAVGNVVYWSAGPDALPFAASGFSAFPPANSMTFSSKVVRMWPCALGLLVFTVSEIQIITGSATSSSPLEPDMFLEGVGLRSYDGWAVNGTTVHMLTTDLQIIALDPGAGLTEEGVPIADLIEAGFGDTSQITFHKQGHRDVALYCGDGALGWYRLSNSAAPESGTPWSPQAVITGGCRALQSVEVSPGVRRLLMGAPTGGPILQRDRTVNTDAGTAFVANAIAGSIMLALPNQLAELSFFTLDSPRLGTRPTLGVLLGEIGGTFETLVRSWQDPPMLPPAQTLFNDRYYMAQNQKPVFCRHFQLAINWAAEDAANELYGYSIVGTTHQERPSA